jgi:hypothetical protein
MARGVTALLLFSVFLVGHGPNAAAGEHTLLSLDVLEQDQGLDGIKENGQKPDDVGKKVDKRFTLQCQKAVGDAGFCECLLNRRPWRIDFVEYVQIVGATRAELKYQSLDGHWKSVVDRARDAREECVRKVWARTPSK